MSNKEIIKEQELENVSGGEWRIVNTGDSRDAAIRSYPGLNAPVVASLPNGTSANTTGVLYAGRRPQLGGDRLPRAGLDQGEHPRLRLVMSGSVNPQCRYAPTAK